MEDEDRLTKQERKALRRKEKISQRGAEERRKLITKIGWYTSLLAVVFLIGLGIFNSIVPIPESEKNKSVDAFTKGDWVVGTATASVKLIEYSDFQCPSCAKSSGMLTELLKQYAGKITLAYRNFPLREIHPQANLAAQAAEAAGKQGKFWEMHDKLFENQTVWAENRGAKDMFIGYAKELKLDLNQFKKDLNSKEVRGLVQADYLSGLEQGISSTPTFFMNGKMMPNPGTLTDFTILIDLSLEEATASKILK